MRAILGLISLLVVVAIGGVLARKQLAAGVAPAPVATQEPGTALPAPAGSPGTQLRQVEQAVQGAIQPRAMPDEGQ